MRLLPPARNEGKPSPVIPFPIETAAPPVRRRLSPAASQALEMLGHAIEYLADEYAASGETKGPLGNADPRVEAIQLLKKLNRELYYSGTHAPVQNKSGSRIMRWFLGE